MDLYDLMLDVSRNANKDDKLGLVYPVRVRLDAADINIEGKRVAIGPGMAVSAEIVTGNRRVIEYLLSPVLRYRDEAGRERYAATAPQSHCSQVSDHDLKSERVAASLAPSVSVRR